MELTSALVTPSEVLQFKTFTALLYLSALTVLWHVDKRELLYGFGKSWFQPALVANSEKSAFLSGGRGIATFLELESPSPPLTYCHSNQLEISTIFAQYVFGWVCNVWEFLELELFCFFLATSYYVAV